MATATTPPWPSLYNPRLEIIQLAHHNATQPGGAYLYHAKDIFRFTLYWTLCFYTPIFLLCGSYAFWNLNFPPPPRTQNDAFYRDNSNEHGSDTCTLPQLGVPMTPTTTNTTTPLRRPVKPPKANEGTSRLAFALLVFLTFLAVGVAGAVVGSSVLGFSVYGLYRSGNFNMSTWIPFLLAVMQVLVGLLSVWPSIIDIM